MAWFCYFVLAILLLNTETDLEFLVLDKKKKKVHSLTTVKTNKEL